ncbi:transmembrane channel-like protein 6b [Austrofundulus limnaeus]|uniref:Transmembrane channel-like protein n=1 Tax=Austrofundulus limnaeus TaxID=52670 RepID=A0A2I4BP22_AUSLI|nr:PREDICTED: transmembrane channel-like protein 6 [Austrofundulus limnaeus]
MARSVNFDLNHPLIEYGLESPADEEGVHDSFNQLIAEQSQNEEMFDTFDQGPLGRRELDKEHQDFVYTSSPPHTFREREPDRGEYELEEYGEQTDPLIPERWSSDTLKILSSMPSRTIGRNRGAIISQYCNKTLQLRRRRQSKPADRVFSRSSRPSIRAYDLEADTTDSESRDLTKQDQLVNNLQNLSASDRERMLRGMPLCLTVKKKLRELASQKEKQTRSSSRINCCSHFKLCIIKSWYTWSSFIHSRQMWKVPLKRVSGRFGTGVLSYFLFLKTLLFFNVFLFLVMGTFLVLPQAVYPPEVPANRRSFSGLELLTGAGYFSDTVMYYGYYCNYTLHRNYNSSTQAWSTVKLPSYNMPLAYFFTIGMAFFITCIILVYSMSKSFGQSFRIDKSYSILAIKTFCSWDFRVIKKNSIKLLSENICTQLKELLGELKPKHGRNPWLERLRRLMVHCLAWLMCVAVTTGCVIGIYYFSDYMHIENQKQGAAQEASLLALPVLVSLINLLLPGLFNFAAWVEDYISPSVRTYVGLSRNLMLKVSVLGVLCYHWLGRIATDGTDYIKCWESFVGQELYRFLIVDFIFTLLDTLFGELLWRLFSDKILKRQRKPEFDIAKNVLDLIYGQTLAWLGVLFSPLLPAVQILKLLLLFYIKMSSVMMNCQAPRRPYRVSQMTTIFITLLCFPSFLGSSVCVTYAMWSIKPSESCGPFRRLQTMLKAGKQWMKQLAEENASLSPLASAHAYLVENPLFLFVGAGIFLIVIYFHSQVLDGQRKIITLLQEHIKNEGEDKKFLITRLQSIHEQKRPSARKLTNQDSTELQEDKPQFSNYYGSSTSG